jgi:hypothetical protein
MLFSCVVSSSEKPLSSSSLAARAMASSWEVGWVRNVRAAAEVELRRGGTAERCLAQEATADEAVPVLRSYLRQFRLVVGPYFDVTPSSPDAEFAAEAPRHPVFLLTRPPEK